MLASRFRPARDVMLRLVPLMSTSPLHFHGTIYTARRWARSASFSEIQHALNTLKVPIEIKEVDLRKAYLNLVRENHPDKGGSEEKMKEITTSYNLLKALSDAERKQYKASRDYGPGQAYSSGPQRPPSYNNPHDAHEAYRRKYEQASRGYYKFDPAAGNYSANTFRGRSNPYAHNPFEATQRSIRFMPFSTLLFRAMLVYMIASVSLLMLWRIYKDYTHDEGWNLSQASWRSERLEALQRMRDEARQRATERERDFANRKRGDLVQAREMRAMDYARRREQEMVSADHGSFPRLNPEGLEGLIMREYSDPVGISYYVPPLPNGAPPFSGNGRFMYSTGSIARAQCIPTARSVAPQESTPSLRPTRTLGDLARPEAAAYADRLREQQMKSASPSSEAPAARPSEDPEKTVAPVRSGVRTTTSERIPLPPNMQRAPYTPKGIELVPPSGYSSPQAQAYVPPPPAPYIPPPPSHIPAAGTQALDGLPPETS